MFSMKFRTQGYQGYSVKFSPFFDSRLCVASATNFGIVGNGRLWVLDVSPQGYLTPAKHFDTQDGLFDASWNEVNENQVVTASGDGSIKLWDVTLQNQPIMNWTEHAREVFSVEWNMTQKDVFVSASWDQTIKLWNPMMPTSLTTLQGHTGCVYAATFSPRQPNLILSASGDQTIKLWDTLQPPGASCVASAFAHSHEVLSADWDKYNPHFVYSSSADKDIKLWDTRRMDVPVCVCRGGPGFGHTFPVRRVKSSPYKSGRVASVGYDMSARMWDMDLERGFGVQCWASNEHTEFVLGVDWCLGAEGRIATCGWDGWVMVHQTPP
ncbi:peroxisomal targeting signal 2 receptor [Sorochytrium milnesiophthora]